MPNLVAQMITAQGGLVYAVERAVFQKNKARSVNLIVRKFVMYCKINKFQILFL